MLHGKENIVTLEEVQAALRTKALTKLKGLKVDDSGEALSVSRGRGGNRGNHVNLKVGDKVKYKCFKCHMTNHFKKNCLGREGNDDSMQLIVASQNYEDVSALVVSCLEEGGVSHLGNNDTYTS